LSQYFYSSSCCAMPSEIQNLEGKAWNGWVRMFY
jgi:hypothetical protein